MAEVQYGRIIENGIANTPKNTLNFTQIYNLVRDQSCPTVSKTTIRRWLRRLEEEEIINREGGHRMRNQVYYSLTDARIFEREFFGSESKSKQNVELTSYIEEGQQEADKKVCILILLQAALDTVLPKFTNEPELGGVYCYNPATGRNECLVGEKLDGVTMKEVLDHRNIGLGGLFDHVNFTQLLRKNNYIEIIQEELGLKNNTIRMTLRKDENGIGIKINDGPLNDYINICACMTSWIQSRLSDTVSVALLNALYKKGKGNLTELPHPSSFSIFEQEAFKLYLSLYGRRKLDYEFKHCKEIFARLMDNVEQGSNNNGNNKKLSKNAMKKKMHEYIQNRKDAMLQLDKNIIALYYGLIKCERYVDAPVLQREEEKYHRNKRYRDYVRRDMPQKFRDLADTVMKVIYPDFLRRYHRNNPKLVEFTKSLPRVQD